MISRSRLMVMVVPAVLFFGGCSQSECEAESDCLALEGTDAGTPGGTDGGGNGTDGGQNQQNNNPRLQPPEDLKASPEPQSTEVGFEIGDAVTKTIGAAGGTVSFGSAGPTIVIPAGALAADTELSIQRISNSAPHKVGQAFRFGPEGTQFGSPVTVTFTVPELPGSTAGIEGLGVAYQDGDGFWQAVSEVTVDKSGKTVSAKTDHFSDWTLFQQTEIRPSIASVAVNKALGLWVYQCTGAMDPVTLIAPLLPECKAATGFTKWSVNGIDSGDATVGTTDAQLYGAAYTAPGKKPSTNPVTVSVEVPMGKRKGLLLANVRVTEDDTCTFEKPCTWSGVSDWEMTSTHELTRAQVRWVVDSKDDTKKHVTYKPEGSVWFQDDETGCAPQNQPLSLAATTGDRDNRLIIDYSGTEPVVSLTDSVAAWDVPVVCPDGSSDHTGVFETYFSDGQPALAEDDTAILGSTVDDSIGHSSNYRYTRD